tara:strand:- start:274 stop:393 length:120 start_codon:yes stop_codon:yes gene_type:complete
LIFEFECGGMCGVLSIIAMLKSICKGIESREILEHGLTP